MSRSFSISIVGAGNLASNLAPELENAGHIINSISSLHLSSAQKLADSLYNTRAIDDNDFSEEDTEIIILAVKDDLITDLLGEIKTPAGASLVHTSGFVPLDALEHFDGPYGVFYPLQSFSKGRKVDFKQVPICIESYDEALNDKLMKLGKSISREVNFISSSERKVIHIAAVFANNFVNHLLNISGGILKDANINPELLKPLVEETVKKAYEIGPENSQTGPAKRGDMNTIQKHLMQLAEYPEIAQLYEQISKQIIKDNF